MLHEQAARLEEQAYSAHVRASEQAARAAAGKLARDMDYYTDWLASECMGQTEARGDWLAATLQHSPAALATATNADLLQLMTLCESVTPAQRNMARVELKRRYWSERAGYLAELTAELAGSGDYS